MFTILERVVSETLSEHVTDKFGPQKVQALILQLQFHIYLFTFSAV